MTKFDVLKSLQISANCFFPLPQGQLGFEGINEDYSMFAQSKHVEIVKNNLKYLYGVSLTGDGGLLTIAFRGSQNDADWKYNLQYAKINAQFDEKPYGKVTESIVGIHTGFREDYRQVEEDMNSLVNTFIGEGINHLLVTGHSLGGALAQVCALDMQYHFGDKITVSSITFGAPRVYNFAGSVSYNKRVPNTIRVVNENDPISRVPFEEMNYHHVGKELNVGMKWWSYAWRIWPISMAFVWDHAPSLYKKHLDELTDTEFNNMVNA